MAALGLVAFLVLVGVPTAAAADTVTLSTPYPGVAVAPGTKVSFDISVKTDESARVDLSLKGVPADWTASLFGGGFVVDGVQTSGTTAATVRLDVTVPATATAATQRIEVAARAGGATDILPLDIRVTPNAAGQVTLTTDFPSLKGPSTNTFTFNLTLHNDTAEDLTFTGVATGPDGWTITTQVSSESQAANALVKAGATTPVTVTAKAPAAIEAGQYPISVDVTSGSRTAHQDLGVEITGSYSMTLSTVDERLNANATAGATTDLTLVVTNTGTAPITGVTLSATPPSGWTVEFDPTTVDVPANTTGVNVTAHLTPSADAIAGDYVASFKATAPSNLASASADIRVTVETSLLWGAVGVALIAVVLVGLWLTFRRFGRR
jgi:uncharacterized repeat protein (TIGR01451 family)